jgi:hypothetical protein
MKCPPTLGGEAVFGLKDNGAVLRSEHEVDHPLFASLTISSAGFLRQNFHSCECLRRNIAYFCQTRDSPAIYKHDRSVSSCAACLRLKRIEKLRDVSCTEGRDVVRVKLEIRRHVSEDVTR